MALISGGLDSMLAARLMRDQGIHVEGINFFTGFCVEGHTHAIRNNKQDKPKRNNALWSAEQVGIKLHIIDVSERPGRQALDRGRQRPERHLGGAANREGVKSCLLP